MDFDYIQKEPNERMGIHSRKTKNANDANSHNLNKNIHIFCVGKLMRTARGTEMEDEEKEKKSQRFKWQAKQNETKFKYENSFDKLLPLYMNFPFVF